MFGLRDCDNFWSFWPTRPEVKIAATVEENISRAMQLGSDHPSVKVLDDGTLCIQLVHEFVRSRRHVEK